MFKRVLATAVALTVLATVGTAFADTAPAPDAVEIEAEAAAGVTPDSRLYGLERALERVRLSLSRSEEKLAELEANLAVERAAEAAVMVKKAKPELAGKAAAEHVKSMAAASAHLKKVKDESRGAKKAVDALGTAQKKSQAVLAGVLEKAPESAREALQQALANQEKSVQAHTAKAAFFVAKAELTLALDELKEARKTGHEAAIVAAEAKVKAAQVKKADLESLKNAAEKIDAEITAEVDQADKAPEKVKANKKSK